MDMEVFSGSSYDTTNPLGFFSDVVNPLITVGIDNAGSRSCHLTELNDPNALIFGGDRESNHISWESFKPRAPGIFNQMYDRENDYNIGSPAE